MISQTEALERIKELATERADTLHSIGHVGESGKWQQVLELIEQTVPREWPTLLDVPKGVQQVFDKGDDVWVRTADSWQMGDLVCWGDSCAEGHPSFGPYTLERKH